MKRAVKIIITIIIVAALFAVGVIAVSTDTIYTEEMLEAIFTISGFDYMYSPTNVVINSAYDVAMINTSDRWYGIRATSNLSTYGSGIYKGVIPISSNYSILDVNVCCGVISRYNSDYQVDEDYVILSSVTGEDINGNIIDLSFTREKEGIYNIHIEQPIVNINMYMTYTYQTSFPYLLYGISSATGTTVIPDGPTTEDLLTSIIELIEMDIVPAVQNINSIITIKYEQEQTSISNLTSTNNTYNNTINNYKNGSITADLAFDQITDTYDQALQDAVDNDSVDEAILANAQFQSKLAYLEKLFSQAVASKYDDLVSDDEKNMVDQAVQLEESILDQFDLEAFRAQTRYDTYYQQIGNQEMLNLKEIYEKILNDDIGNDFVIIPLTFSILAILLGATGALIAKGKKSND